MRPVRGVWARALTGIAVATAGLAAPGEAHAQVAWDSPRLIGPESPGGLALYWLRSSAVGDEVDGAVATWALPGLGGSVIVRGGVAIDAEDELSGMGGVDLRAPIARHTDGQPLDVEWHAGIGAGGWAEEGGYVVVTLPMGVSAGRSWTSGAVWLAPYVSLGLALDLALGGEAPEDEFTVSPASDVGLDFALDPARRMIVRVAMSLGDRQALAVGLSFGGAR